MYRAQLIEMNFDLVERATLVIRSAIASSMDWGDIELLVKDAQARGDPVAMVIQGLKLSSNGITLLLRYKYQLETDLDEVRSCVLFFKGWSDCHIVSLFHWRS